MFDSAVVRWRRASLLLAKGGRARLPKVSWPKRSPPISAGKLYKLRRKTRHLTLSVAPVTVVRTKYRTLSPTFTGEVGGYTTVKKDPKETTTTPRAVTTTPKAKETPKTTEDPDDSDPTTQIEPTIATDRGLSSSAATGTPLPIATQSTLPDSSNGGSGAGAKAGIAIGVIAGILVIAGLVFFLFKRKKKNAERQSLEDDEKLHGAFNSGNYAPTAAAAAAVSAAAVASGPATGGNLNQEKPLGGFAAAPVPFNRGQPQPQPQHHQSRSNGSGWERPGTSQSQQNPNNPFGTHAELSGSQPPSPQSGAPIAAAAAVAGGATAYQGLKRQASRNHGPAALDLTITPPPLLQAVPPSPAGTEYSVSSITPGQQVPNSSGAAVIAAAGGPAGSTVHRVQLDFKPTMDDELDLKAGQLVRLLHEYDDGWVSGLVAFFQLKKRVWGRSILINILFYRLSAFDWIGHARVWFPGLVSLHAR